MSHSIDVNLETFSPKMDTQYMPHGIHDSVLRIPGSLAHEIKYFIDKVDVKECQWYHCVERQIFKDKGMVVYTLSEMFIPEQEVTAGTVDTEADGMGKLGMEILKKYSDEDAAYILEHMTGWSHSHVNMDVIPSKTDWDSFEQLIKNLTSVGSEAPIIMMIFNKKGEIFSQVYDPLLGITIRNPRVWISNKVEVNKGHIDAEIKSKIQEKKFTHYGGGSHSSGTSSRRGAGSSYPSAKRNTPSRVGLANIRVCETKFDGLFGKEFKDASAEIARVLQDVQKEFSEPSKKATFGGNMLRRDLRALRKHTPDLIKLLTAYSMLEFEEWENPKKVSSCLYGLDTWDQTEEPTEEIQIQTIQESLSNPLIWPFGNSQFTSLVFAAADVLDVSEIPTKDDELTEFLGLIYQRYNYGIEHLLSKGSFIEWKPHGYTI